MRSAALKIKVVALQEYLQQDQRANRRQGQREDLPLD